MLKGLGVLTFTLAVMIIFSDLLVGLFDLLLVQPVLSKVGSSLLTDVSFILLTALIAGFSARVDFKKYGTQYRLQGVLVCFILIYLYQRVIGSHYTFAGFSIFPQLAYTDLLLLLPLLYLALLNFSLLGKKQTFSSGRNASAQKVIKSYLAQKTNYALLINGKRGTGKTYFMKHTVQPMIDNTLIDPNKEGYYTAIFISLYGLKSIDEIYFQLAVAIKPYLKHLTIQSGSVLAGILARGLVNLSGAGTVEEYVDAIKSAAKEDVQSSDFVMIFDDLDRISGGFSVDEFIGFVNSMVEHENNKVIIIADELKIEQKELYHAAREKSIGIVVDFRNDFPGSVADIVNGRFKDDVKFMEVFKALEADIFKVFKHWKSDNLRTFIYFLNHYQVIYACIDAQGDEPEIRLGKLKDAAEYCALFCIEFSKGAISFSSPNGINEPGRVNSYLTLRFQREMFKVMRKVEQEKNNEVPVARVVPYIESFALNFTQKNHYYFYQSIFDFVTGGDELDRQLLSQELKENVTDRIYKLTKEELVFQRLSYPQVYDLSNEEYIEANERMFRYALEGRYPLNRYGEIYFRFHSHPKIKTWPARETAEALIEAMLRHKDRFSHDPKLEVHRRHTDRSSFTVEEKNIDEMMWKINSALGVQDSMFRRRSLFDVFVENPEKFYDACNHDYLQKAVFDTWDFPSFLSVFKSMPPSAILEFNHFIKSRYAVIEDTSWVEYDFISNLFNKARTPSEEEDEPFTFRREVEDELLTILMDIIGRYSAINPSS